MYQNRMSARSPAILPPARRPRLSPGVDIRILVDGIETWQAPASREPATYSLYLQGGRLELGWDVPTAHDGRWSLVVDGDVTPLIGSGSIEVSGSARAQLHTGGAEPESWSRAGSRPEPTRSCGTDATRGALRWPTGCICISSAPDPSSRCTRCY